MSAPLPIVMDDLRLAAALARFALKGYTEEKTLRVRTTRS